MRISAELASYALLLTLRFGVPPYRVASFFLESGTWQAEDVTEQTLVHAADRVIAPSLRRVRRTPP